MLVVAFTVHHLAAVATNKTNETAGPRDDGKDDDDDVFDLSFEDYIVGLISLLTAIVAPYSFVVGIPGITANGCPIPYPSETCCCGFGARCPTHWTPPRLCLANIIAAVSSGFLTVSSLLYAIVFDNWFLGVVGCAINGVFFLLCTVAAKRLYEPRSKLKRILRAVFQDDTLFTDL